MKKNSKIALERPIDRIKAIAQFYIDNGALASMKNFEEACNLSSMYVKNLSATQKGNPGVDVVAKIYRTFRGISLNYIILGEGDMFTIPWKEALDAAKEIGENYKLQRSIKRMLKDKSKEEILEIISKM